MKTCRSALILLLILLPPMLWGQEDARWTMAFWNVENLFDTQHDTLKDDCAFTPQGDNHWTAKRYADTRNKIYKMIAAMGNPVLVGMAEVENDRVLNDLCRYTPLRKRGYEYVHYESPDVRGVDCALLYRSERFCVLEKGRIEVSDSGEHFYTRDILMVGGVVVPEGDTCYVMVNHWPSKLNGHMAESRRMKIACRLRAVMDSVQRAHPGALVVAVGDFNAAPEEEAISVGMGFGDGERNAEGFYNLMAGVEKGTGTYKYRDAWSCIDQVIANRKLDVEIFAADFMMVDDEKYMGKKLFRTYSGMKYLGGYSDHLPIKISVP